VSPVSEVRIGYVDEHGEFHVLGGDGAAYSGSRCSSWPPSWRRGAARSRSA
jgi:hypothetical protein